MRPLALAPTALLLALAFGAAAPAAAQRILWTSPAGTLTLPEVPVSAAFSTELADDFDVWGDVTGLAIAGAECQDCAPARVAAVEVRFWSWRAGGGPGPLEAEYRLEVGDDHLKLDPSRPGQIDVRLASPFAAHGRHFVSLQLEFVSAGVWSWYRGRDAQRLEPAWERGEAGSWAPAGPVAPSGDLAFDLATAPWDGVDLARGCGRLELEAPAWPAGISAWRLTDVAALDAERAFAVGTAKAADGERALAFARRAGLWKPMAPPLPEGARLVAVEAMPSGAIWFAGSYLHAAGPAATTRRPLVLVYHPERGLWERLEVPAESAGEGELVDLVADGAGQVWLVGAASPTVDGAVRRSALVLRWDGAAFERFELPPAPGGAAESLAAVASAGATVWAVGGGSLSGLAGTPLVARWNGRAWERVAAFGLDRAGSLDAVAARDDEVWIGGATLAADPLLVHFDGFGWSSHASPVGGRAIEAPKSGEFLTAGVGLASFRDDLWQAEPGASGFELSGLSGLGECSLFAAGWQAAQGAERGILLRLVPEGFADGFESRGFEAWSGIVAPAAAPVD